MQVAGAAPRFTLSLPMRYRPIGHNQWRVAKTVNVSASGLLFIAAERLPAGSRVELEVSMAASMLKPTHLSTVSEVLRQGTDDEPMITTVRHLKSKTVDGELSL